jgi:hypothetical protein
MEVLSAWLKLAAKVDSVEEFAKRIRNWYMVEFNLMVKRHNHIACFPRSKHGFRIASSSYALFLPPIWNFTHSRQSCIST